MSLSERILALPDQVEGKRPWEFSCNWYRPDETERCILQKFQEDCKAIPADVKSRAFAEWITEQYRLAMNKGIQLGCGASKSAASAHAAKYEQEQAAHIKRLEVMVRRVAVGYVPQDIDAALNQARTGP